MTFEQDYKKFTDYALSILRRFDIPNLFPEDAVNEAYVQYVNTGITYTPKTIRNLILTIIHKESAILKIPLCEKFIKKNTHGDYDTTKICSTCKELKPMGAFPYCFSKRDERKKPRLSCKECVSKQVLAWNNKNIDKIKAWREKNKERISAINKEYKKKIMSIDPDGERERNRLAQRKFQEKKRGLKKLKSAA